MESLRALGLASQDLQEEQANVTQYELYGKAEGALQPLPRFSRMIWGCCRQRTCSRFFLWPRACECRQHDPCTCFPDVLGPID